MELFLATTFLRKPEFLLLKAICEADQQTPHAYPSQRRDNLEPLVHVSRDVRGELHISIRKPRPYSLLLGPLGHAYRQMPSKAALERAV